MKKQLRPYILAGLDFMVDQEGNFVFIEANSNPAMMLKYKALYKKEGPVDYFIDALRHEKQITFLYSQEYVEGVDYGFTYGMFKLALQSKCRQVIFPQKSFSTFQLPLKDVNGNVIDSGAVWNSRLSVKKELSKNKKFHVINTAAVCEVTLNKFKTSQAVAAVKGIRIPKTFFGSTQEQILGLIEKHNLMPCVIKPQSGRQGAGIIIIHNKKQLASLKLKSGKWIVQEKINVKKHQGKFWCLRAYVVDGKYVGALRITSRNSIVNATLGGKIEIVEKSLQKKLAPLAEKCVVAIEKFAGKKK